ncbi:MAG: glutamate 5-kinase [Acidimicrobiia bacterium]|nr:glutamate 5-kinase [Acidimicrobiia bacterium]
MRRSVAPGAPVVVKVGSSSLSNESGGIDGAAVDRIIDALAELSAIGNPPVLVTSAAISAGMPVLGMDRRPTDVADLQVAAAVGQTQLMERYAAGFGRHGMTVGQVLLTRDVLGNRTQYLNARSAFARMVTLGVVPIVNENDTVVVDELKFGDNDRLAAIASHLVGADMLIILTDTPGLYTDDPRFFEDAQLLSAVRHSDEVLDEIRKAPGRGRLGSGGVATKVTAARMAAYSGIPTVIARSTEDQVVARIVRGDEVGTWVDPRPDALPARKLWIAFGLPALGLLKVDDGASKALTSGGRSLLSAGVTEVQGVFERGDAVEVVDPASELIAKGIVRVSSDILTHGAGKHSSELGGEVIHRDDMVVLGASAGR